jgi:hypothetical protein
MRRLGLIATTLRIGLRAAGAEAEQSDTESHDKVSKGWNDLRDALGADFQHDGNLATVKIR